MRRNISGMRPIRGCRAPPADRGSRLRECRARVRIPPALVIRIGDIRPLRMMRAESDEPVHLAQCGSVGRQPRYPLVVAVVHDHYAVEQLEVLFAYLAGAVCHLYAACGGGASHARIGQLARVAGVGASPNLSRSRCGLPSRPQRSHYGLGRRRTADVAQANEQYFVFHRVLFSANIYFLVRFAHGAIFVSDGRCPKRLSQ